MQQKPFYRTQSYSQICKFHWKLLCGVWPQWATDSFISSHPQHVDTLWTSGIDLASGHYLNQFRLMISNLPWHHHQKPRRSQSVKQDLNLKFHNLTPIYWIQWFKIYLWWISFPVVAPYFWWEISHVFSSWGADVYWTPGSVQLGINETFVAMEHTRHLYL